MSEASSPINPYEAYFRAMMDMQMEMAKSYAAMQKNMENASPMMPPFVSPMMHPHMAPNFQNGMMPPPQNQWGHGMPPQPHQMQNYPPPQSSSQPPPQQTEGQSGSDALFEQAQAMLNGALGEDAGMFNEILGAFGMSDKEFWKGAAVGAAAALILSNENVRGKLMGLVSGAGDLLKTGGASVKDAATNTAASVKDNVSAGSEIFKDTVVAGKQGFQESVEKHKTESKDTAENSPESSTDESLPEPEIKEP